MSSPCPFSWKPNVSFTDLAPEYWPKSTTTKISQRTPRGTLDHPCSVSSLNPLLHAAEALGRRINAEGQFMTALTLVAPNTKSGPVLHPHVRITLTRKVFTDGCRYSKSASSPFENVHELKDSPTTMNSSPRVNILWKGSRTCVEVILDGCGSLTKVGITATPPDRQCGSSPPGSCSW